MLKHITIIALAAGLAGCAGSTHRATSRRPGLLAEHHDTCQPVAVSEIHNTGACRVQVVARAEDGQVLRSSPWISAGTHGDRFELPAEFAWVVLEVDPSCDERYGTIRYELDRARCNRGPEAAW